jgi:hypothetical protein
MSPSNGWKHRVISANHAHQIINIAPPPPGHCLGGRECHDVDVPRCGPHLSLGNRHDAAERQWRRAHGQLLRAVVSAMSRPAPSALYITTFRGHSTLTCLPACLAFAQAVGDGVSGALHRRPGEILMI